MAADSRSNIKNNKNDKTDDISVISLRDILNDLSTKDSLFKALSEYDLDAISDYCCESANKNRKDLDSISGDLTISSPIGIRSAIVAALAKKAGCCYCSIE